MGLNVRNVSLHSISFGDTLTRIYLRTSLLILLFFILLISMASHCVQAGLCWSSPNRNGRCTDLLKTGVTKDECCNGVDGANYGIATTAYSPEDLKSGQLFYYRALRGGVPCTPCKTTCEGVQCGSGMKCVVKEEREPVCVCSPKCSRRKRRMGSVCGSDGHTYRHICRLLKRKCRKDFTLTVAYYGSCQESCDKVRCVDTKTCILDNNLKPHCVRCKQNCPPINPGTRPVCGVNNATYASYCDLQRVACLSGKAIQVAYRGECKRNASCSTINCNRNRKCLVDVLNNNEPRCVTCPMPCPRHLSVTKSLENNKMICASNNVTYANWCSMMNDACSSGIYLYAMSGHSCHPNEGLMPNAIQENNIIPNTLFKINPNGKVLTNR